MIQRETFEKAAEDLKNSAYPTQVEATALIDGKPENFTAFGVGLSKRELFAAMAMQGFISGCYAGQNAGFTVQGNCFAAVEYADSLLALLSRTPHENPAAP